MLLIFPAIVLVNNFSLRSCPSLFHNLESLLNTKTAKEKFSDNCGNNIMNQFNTLVV